MTFKLYPRYVNNCTFELESLCKFISDGTIDSIIMEEFKKIDSYSLGRFSTNITAPYNNLIIVMLVDLNVIKNESNNDIYKLRVEHIESDGFIDIKTDILSIQKAVYDIMCNKIPLHNITPNIDVNMYDYILE